MAKCISPVDIINTKFASQSRFNPDVTSIIAVPCGKCPNCLESRRGDWSLRLAIELEHSTGAHFVTLTYNDENIYINENGAPSVLKKDMQDYMKRLRKTTTTKLRYYTIGEYGTKTQRPHYHILLFNYPKGKDHHITTSWLGKGHTKVGTVTAASIHYVTKYHVNKSHFPELANPSFALMSQGIGKDYIKTHKNYHDGNINKAYYTDLGGTPRRLPRYLKDKLYNKKERRQIVSKYEKLQIKKDKDEHYHHTRFNPCKNFYELEEEKKSEILRKFREKRNETDTF